jgi:hypothetical protein
MMVCLKRRMILLLCDHVQNSLIKLSKFREKMLKFLITIAFSVTCFVVSMSASSLSQGTAGVLECNVVANAAAFPLVDEGQAASLHIDRRDAKVVEIAARLLSEDIEQVTGIQPTITDGLVRAEGRTVVIGTIGQSQLIDQLIVDQKLDVSHIKGCWEAFLITTVDDSLIIAGADRRGTAFGVFTLSKAIGVSPLNWWSEVVPAKQEELHIVASGYTEGSPSVKYRGLFINDEAFGPGSLHDWTKKTFETEEGHIGPKTYAKVFELLLRLKANYCWPAMHRPSKGFNTNPKNAQVADDYAIVMGSSHCEQMLRNNVSEWVSRKRGAWNYKINRDNIYSYWQERLEANKNYENTYTIGMRSKHDSPMSGADTMDEVVSLTSQAVKDQRQLLADIINPDLTQVPQVFCPYKEVLEIYQNGLEVPEDITLIWPDDNNGFMRQLSTPEEQRRSGGAGVYYHLSVLGVPDQFLWLSTISPSLISFELSLAYDYGAQRIWMFNVGDIKPSEKEFSFAMDLAWDINRWSPETANSYARHWAIDTFGKEQGEDIGELLEEHYRLAAAGKPEHVFRLEYTEMELEQRLQDYHKLSADAEAIGENLPERLQDAYNHLILYPINGCRYINDYWLLYRRSMLNAAKGEEIAARSDFEKSKRAREQLDLIDVSYNGAAGGKWNHIITWKNKFRETIPKSAAKDLEKLINDCRNASDPVTLSLEDAIIAGDVVRTDHELYGNSDGGTATFRWEAENAGISSVWVRTTAPIQLKPDWIKWNRVVAAHEGTKVPKPEKLSEVLSGHLNGMPWSSQKIENTGGLGGATRGAPLWHQLATVEIKQGWNELTLNLSNPYMIISEVRLGMIKPFPAEHLQVIPAVDFINKGKGKHSEMNQFAGLGSGWGLASMPFTAPSLDATEIADAPWLEYSLEMPAGASRLQIRTLPNQPIHAGRGVRYAVSIDGAEPEVFDVYSEEFDPEWSHNVLHGYTSRFIDYEATKKETVNVRVYLLDPGLVLTELVVSPAR